MRIMEMSGRLLLQFISLNLRWPYHAKVMKVLESASRVIVASAFIKVDS
jgi:hypothetical protein